MAFLNSHPFHYVQFIGIFHTKIPGILNYIQDIYSLGLSSLKVLYIVIISICILKNNLLETVALYLSCRKKPS